MIIIELISGEKPHPCPVCLKPFRMRSDMKRHMQMHARDGSDVSLLLAIEQGEQSFDGIAGDSDALAALREKAGIIEVKRGDRSRRVLKVRLQQYYLNSIFFFKF